MEFLDENEVGWFRIIGQVFNRICLFISVSGVKAQLHLQASNKMLRLFGSTRVPLSAGSFFDGPEMGLWQDTPGRIARSAASRAVSACSTSSAQSSRESIDSSVLFWTRQSYTYKHLTRNSDYLNW